MRRASKFLVGVIGLSVLFLLAILVFWANGMFQNVSLDDSVVQLIVRDGGIYEKIAGEERHLFLDAQNVKKARFGPDGKSIHFLVIPDSRRFLASCANLKDFSDFIPFQKAPWDYGSVGHGYFMRTCGSAGYSGGYLKNAPFFAHIEITPSGETVLFIENLSTKKKSEISLPRDSFQDVEEKNNVRGGYCVDGCYGVKAESGSFYLYPVQDAYLMQEKLVLAFADILIAVDVEKNIFLGSEVLSNPPEQIISSSVEFDFQENFPFIFITSGWSHGRVSGTILDLSRGRLVLENFPEYSDPGRFGYGAPSFAWDEAGLTIQFYKEIEVTDEISKEEIAQLLKNLDSSEEAIAVTTSTDKYQEVSCFFDARCFTITEGSRYTITPGKSLIKIL